MDTSAMVPLTHFGSSVTQPACFSMLVAVIYREFFCGLLSPNPFCTWKLWNLSSAEQGSDKLLRSDWHSYCFLVKPENGRITSTHLLSLTPCSEARRWGSLAPDMAGV